jgi:membrane protease YdiL (CAAX protease family)
MFKGAGDSIAAVAPMMYTPGLSAIITALLFKEKISAFGWRPGKIRFLLYAFFLPVIVSMIGYGLVWLTEFSEFTKEEVVNYRWAKMIGFELPAPFIVGFLSKMILASLIAIVFVLGEEIGWSGYLTPKLRKVCSIPCTSIIVGFYWAIWHFPAIIGGFYGHGTPLWASLPGFTMVLIGASFIRTTIVEQSKSLWAGVVLHTSHNVILMSIFREMSVRREYTDYLVSETGLLLGAVYLLVAFVFLRFQSNPSDIKTIYPK